ncbi:hypothetical protein J5690_08195 [bacterium]|nr:hypothetical protein [bacterium]
MVISKYEAAVYYDQSRVKVLAKKYLVIDLDDCSYGVCECDEQGKIKLLNSRALNINLWDSCVNAVKDIIDEFSDGLQDEIERQLLSEKNNIVLRNYICSDRSFDQELFNFQNQTILCREFEEGILSVKTSLKELFDDLNQQENDNSFFIVLGRAQGVFLITYYIKESFSPAPLLPDERFRNTGFKDNSDEIVRIGNELFDSKIKFQHNYRILVFDKETKSMEYILAVDKGQAEDDSQARKYVGPILLMNNDILLVNIDEKSIDIKVPHKLDSLGGILVDLAIGKEEEKDILFVRLYNSIEQIYKIELESEE